VKHRDYVERQRQDPEYLKAEAELRPALNLAADIIRLRVTRGWSQKELARKLRTRKIKVSRLEHGQANPTLRTLHRLSEVFEVDLTVQLGETNTPQRR
jgi:transcriptional regulator with XRE-family HTH domain